MPRRPTRDPYARPAIQTLERLHAELGGKILENKQEHASLADQMRLRTAEQPLTAREIAGRVLTTAKVTNPKKDALADLIGTINSSLRNHDGKGVQRTNEGSPARWRISG